MGKPIISIVAALTRDNGIGKNNQLLWHIPEDLKHFKKITLGHPVIMGQRTFESIGVPLPGRINIVLSDNKKFSAPGILVASSLEEAIRLASEKDKQEIFIIGGGSVYHQTIDLADRLYLTIVRGKYSADTFFPEYKSKFKKMSESGMMRYGNCSYKFTVYKK